MDYKTLGQNIRRLRVTQGFRQEDLAENQLLAHEFSHPEEIYLKKISERIEKYPVSKRILACEGFNTYLDSLEKFSKT